MVQNKGYTDNEDTCDEKYNPDLPWVQFYGSTNGTPMATDGRLWSPMEKNLDYRCLSAAPPGRAVPGVQVGQIPIGRKIPKIGLKLVDRSFRLLYKTYMFTSGMTRGRVRCKPSSDLLLGRREELLEFSPLTCNLISSLKWTELKDFQKNNCIPVLEMQYSIFPPKCDFFIAKLKIIRASWDTSQGKD